MNECINETILIFLLFFFYHENALMNEILFQFFFVI